VRLSIRDRSGVDAQVAATGRACNYAADCASTKVMDGEAGRTAELNAVTALKGCDDERTVLHTDKLDAVQHAKHVTARG
jgi:hypothetical protein